MEVSLLEVWRLLASFCPILEEEIGDAPKIYRIARYQDDIDHDIDRFSTSHYVTCTASHKCRNGPWAGDLRRAELPFFDFVRQPDPAQSYFRIPERLEPRRRITSLLHDSMILLNQVIQALVGPDGCLSGQYAFDLRFGDGLMERPTVSSVIFSGASLLPIAF